MQLTWTTCSTRFRRRLTSSWTRFSRFSSSLRIHSFLIPRSDKQEIVQKDRAATHPHRNTSESDSRSNAGDSRQLRYSWPRIDNVSHSKQIIESAPDAVLPDDVYRISQCIASKERWKEPPRVTEPFALSRSLPLQLSQVIRSKL